MTSVGIRAATATDADALTAVFLTSRAAAMPWLPALHTDAETRWWVEHVVLAECAAWVAVVDQQVVGFAALRDDVLEHLYLRPEVQRQGVGTRLLDRVRQARPDGITLSAFARNTSARAFYEAHGFSVTGSGSDNEEAEPDVTYAWAPGRGSVSQERGRPTGRASGRSLGGCHCRVGRRVVQRDMTDEDAVAQGHPGVGLLGGREECRHVIGQVPRVPVGAVHGVEQSGADGSVCRRLRADEHRARLEPGALGAHSVPCATRSPTPSAPARSPSGTSRARRRPR